jgi:hypothetical protein
MLCVRLPHCFFAVNCCFRFGPDLLKTSLMQWLSLVTPQTVVLEEICFNRNRVDAKIPHLGSSTIFPFIRSSRTKPQPSLQIT